MDEQPTTETVSVDSGAATAQPEAVDTSSAANAPEQPQTETTNTEVSEPSSDDTLEWLKNKGIDPESPEGLQKLANSYRNLEKSFHEKSKKAAELEKSVVGGFNEAVDTEVSQGTYDADDPRIAVRRLEIKQQVRDFFDDNPEAKDYEAAMAKIVKQKPHLSGDLDALYALAKVSDSGREEKLKSDASRETLETLASKQRASAPTGSAVNPVGGGENKITSSNVDALVAKNGPEWYRANRAEILRVAGLSAIN